MSGRSTFVGAALARARAELLEAGRTTWPSARWRSDPVGFCRDVIGLEPTAEQAAIAEALRDGPRVAVAAGRKVGKSEIAAALALWYYYSFPGATVTLIGPTDEQIRDVLWSAIRNQVARAKIPLDPAAVQPSTGMRSTTFPLRALYGRSVKLGIALQGTAGNTLYVIDEAAGVPDFVFETISGNQAGGGEAKLLAVGNPNRADGYFFECFGGRRFASSWHTFQISSLSSPNVIAGHEVIPFMASREWAERELADYGLDSPFYRIHVLGEFVTNEAGRVINADTVCAAQAAWEGADASGPLHVGIDPAGPGGDGDETAFAVRRGNKMLALRCYRGLDPGGVWETLRGILHEFRGRDLKPIVVVDATGAVGGPVVKKLIGISRSAQGASGFHVIPVRANLKAFREPLRFGYVRDELWARLASWLHEGGGILADDKLAGELTRPMWEQDTAGRARVEDKDRIKKSLGRSPDRADALALAVWPSGQQVANSREPQAAPERAGSAWAGYDDTIATMDPYGASDWAHAR